MQKLISFKISGKFCGIWVNIRISENSIRLHWLLSSVRGYTWPAKGYHEPHPTPRRGSGGEGHRMVAKFKILKWFEVLENESIFQKISTFFLPEKSNFFLRKLSKNYFTNFHFMEHPLSSEKFSVEFYYLVENFIKKCKKSLLQKFQEFSLYHYSSSM